MPRLPDIEIDPAPALFLDFDGTLVDIVARPDLTRVSPETLRLVGRLREHLDGALAIVSGRPVPVLDRLLDPLKLPAAGIHGIQQRHAEGRTEICSPQPVPVEIRREIAGLAAAHPGLVFEHQEFSVSLHYRQLPELEQMLKSRLEEMTGHLDPIFFLQNGKMVFELKPVGIDKGSAIDKFMSEAPFKGRFAIYIGDDVTDEDAFAVVNRIGGYSARVGEPDQSSSAQFSLQDVADVRIWLETLERKFA